MRSRFTLITAALVLLALGPETGLRAKQTWDQPAGAALSPRNASYEIEVTLDHATRTLRGRETLRWRNISANPAGELQFHLYWNAWRNADSTWLRERRLGGGAPPRPDMFGSIDVTSIRLRRESDTSLDLTPQLRFISPDDGNSDDRTVFSVPLPAPVAPLQDAIVDIEWTAKIPRPFARTGWIDDYYFIAQWFPKIGVLEDEGWNTHQFHSPTEFYADFGVYDVRITVPGGFVLGASGKRVEQTPNSDGTVTHRYRGEDIHDFAWTASPHYLDLSREFTHPTLPKVNVRLLLLEEHRHLEERYFQITFDTLQRYGEWFGAYPYDHVTVVDPSYQGGNGGMEYPTLFTGRSNLLTPENVQVPESTTAHEAGHQWWYGIVATNEFEHAWMDEGINTYATARVIEEAFPDNVVERRYFRGFIPWAFRDIPVKRATDGNRLPGYRPAARSDVPATPTYRYWPGTAGLITYNKTALWLHTLENMVGWPVMQQTLATYFDRWKFRHPQPDDFFAIVNETTGQDFTWFFDEVYRTSRVFDYAIQDFSSVGGRQSAVGSGSTFRTTVVVQRVGDGVFPVDVVTTFRGGEQVTERWDGRGQRAMWTYERPEQAVSVEVDPRRVLLLDVNYTNNSRTLEPRAGEAALKWAMKWMVWLQDAMVTYAFFV
ncbi:MAG: M1 family metallopeptidase [Vicinamibacterales bacterium]